MDGVPVALPRSGYQHGDDAAFGVRDGDVSPVSRYWCSIFFAVGWGQRDSQPIPRNILTPTISNQFVGAAGVASVSVRQGNKSGGGHRDGFEVERGTGGYGRDDMVNERGRSDLVGICATFVPLILSFGRSILVALLLVPAGLAITTAYRRRGLGSRG